MASAKIPFDKLLFNLLRATTDADIAMQLNQLEVWREAAKNHPYLRMENAIPSSDRDQGEMRQALSSLMEGVDRQHNLAIGKVTLELSLEKVRTPFFKWLHALVTSVRKPIYYRLAPPAHLPSQKPRIKLTVEAKRKPVGSWKVSAQTEHYPEDLANSFIPTIV